MYLSDFISFIRWSEAHCLEMVGLFGKTEINIAYFHCILTIKHISRFSNLSQKDLAALHLEYDYSLKKMSPYIF